ncbi:hypothetical protein BDY21DRAFT_339472 [Lineolata rhizophorae]|uniref:Uncharacterized protein n=1 Tax=Lineolata rhizophorae TaxID=578093 RepID=A0A6A6P4S8_9PEZI|nr:hypothetical protein BDY21DRAFT_339472 [Lineolata rhizophorae]
MECPRWSQQRKKLKEPKSGALPRLTELLGAYGTQEDDGDLSKWKPNWPLVKKTIEFAIETGRLDWQAPG